MQAHTHPHPETPEVYYVPPPSVWPLVGSTALLTLATGFVLVLNKILNVGERLCVVECSSQVIGWGLHVINGLHHFGRTN